MAIKKISRLILVGLCIAVAFIAGSVLCTGENYDPLAYGGHLTVLDQADAYKALQETYPFSGPQSALDRANALKAIQKLTGTFGSQSALDRADELKAIQKISGKIGDYGPF